MVEIESLSASILLERVLVDVVFAEMSSNALLKLLVNVVTSLDSAENPLLSASTLDVNVFKAPDKTDKLLSVEPRLDDKDVTSLDIELILPSVVVTRLVKEVSESAAALIAVKLESIPDRSIASKVADSVVTSEDNAGSVSLSWSTRDVNCCKVLAFA